jgi:hypothetical protein
MVLERSQEMSEFVICNDADTCAGCRYFNHGCRVGVRSSVPAFNVPLHTIRTAFQRRGLRPEDPVVDARLMRSRFHRQLEAPPPFREGTLPLRGLVCSTIMIYALAYMVNVWRTHQYRRKKATRGLLCPFDWLSTQLYEACALPWASMRSELLGADRKVADRRTLESRGPAAFDLAYSSDVVLEPNEFLN